MLATPSADLSSTALVFKAFLENSYDNRNVVHVTAGSFVPLLKNSVWFVICLLYTSPSPRDATLSRMPSSA